jgi:hypothetical protein
MASAAGWSSRRSFLLFGARRTGLDVRCFAVWREAPKLRSHVGCTTQLLLTCALPRIYFSHHSTPGSLRASWSPPGRDPEAFLLYAVS